VDAARGAGEPLPADGKRPAPEPGAGDADPDADGLTVGRLAARFGLSRTTLLYYDRLGLLPPSSRSSAGYRRYGRDDVVRLATICRLRRVGLPLETIGRLLDSSTPDLVEALAVRLGDLDDQIEDLRGQQRTILAALAAGTDGDRTWSFDKDHMVALLAQAGITGARQTAWHAAAEAADASLHTALLESLHLRTDEIARIRRQAAVGRPAGRTTTSARVMRASARGAAS
jgi:DNA-binding transcriptional MerR regulator